MYGSGPPAVTADMARELLKCAHARAPGGRAGGGCAGAGCCGVQDSVGCGVVAVIVILIRALSSVVGCIGARQCGLRGTRQQLLLSSLLLFARFRRLRGARQLFLLFSLLLFARLRRLQGALGVGGETARARMLARALTHGRDVPLLRFLYNRLHLQWLTYGRNTLTLCPEAALEHTPVKAALSVTPFLFPPKFPSGYTRIVP